MILSNYSSNVRDIINDPSASFFSSTVLTRFINRARTYVAKEAQCIRYLTPGQAGIASFTSVAGGSGYLTAPTVTISGPDMLQGPSWTQATATAHLTGDAVTSVTVNVAGSGYVATPTVTFSGGSGTGADFTAVLSPHFVTTAGVEVYTFAQAATAINVTGVQGVIDILSISIAYSGIKPTLIEQDWGSFQAWIRSYSQGQQYPCIWAKYAQGESGSFYLGPIPSATYAIECDCVCTPIALVDDTTVDLIPDNWNEAVFYKAAQYAYENAQRRDDANAMEAVYRQKMASARANSSSVFIPNFYPSEF